MIYYVHFNAIYQVNLSQPFLSLLFSVCFGVRFFYGLDTFPVPNQQCLSPDFNLTFALYKLITYLLTY